MAIKIVDTLLPTTMVGSYPRPHWYKHQLRGRDIQIAFKEVEHEEAYHDAVGTAIRDQEEAGLDIVTDGNMWYDDYVGVIGSFCWYMYERIGGFEAAREPHPSVVNAPPSQMKEIFDDWGGVINSGAVSRGPIRLADLYRIAAKHAKRPVKVSVGAGTRQPCLACLLQTLQECAGFELCPRANLQCRNERTRCRRSQVPASLKTSGHGCLFSRVTKTTTSWIREVVEQCCDGVDAKISWHFCFGNAWGNDLLSGSFPDGYQTVLPITSKRKASTSSFWISQTAIWRESTF